MEDNISQAFRPLLAKRPSVGTSSPERLVSSGTSTLSSAPPVEDSSKRRKLSPTEYPTLNPVSSCRAPPLASSRPTSERLPTLPLLYHLALNAHRASHKHLQQAFIPSSVQCEPNPSYPPITIPPSAPASSSSTSSPDSIRPTPLTHDWNAAEKATGLQILALDLLRLGLQSPEISDRETAYFGYEFGIVGLKVYMIVKRREAELENAMRKGKKRERQIGIGSSQLMNDILAVVAKALSASQRSPHLRVVRQQLEVLNARLAFIRGKGNLGARMIRQCLASAPNDDVAHRYALHFLLLEFADGTTQIDPLNTMNDLEREAHGRGHLQLIQLVRLARVRFLFAQRRWDRLQAAISDCALAVGWNDDPSLSSDIGASVEDSQAWNTALSVQYLLMKCLWEGRIGNDAVVKGLLKQVYLIMDEMTESGSFANFRRSGGLVTLNLRPSSISSTPYQTLNVQITPPNILYLLTYLTTVVSRRDYLGTDAACKNLVHPRSMRESEDVARAEEMWDIGFSSLHSLEDVEELRMEVMTIRAEMMLEEATTLAFRSDVVAVDKMISRIITFLRSENLFATLAPQLCLLHAQYAHLLGNVEAAKRYYKAAQSLIMPGSELGLVVHLGLKGVEGGLEGLIDSSTDHEKVQEIDSIASKYKLSSNVSLSAGGWFMASLTDSNRVSAKKSLSTAYELSHKANNTILRCLIFAFTTSSHLYGNKERTMRQLETGRDLAGLMGGKDREDKVGQVALGLWFWVKLQDQYRQDGNRELEQAAKKSVETHLVRLKELSAYARDRFPVFIS